MNTTAKLMLLLFTSITIIQNNKIVLAQTAEKINRGIPWFYSNDCCYDSSNSRWTPPKNEKNFIFFDNGFMFIAFISCKIIYTKLLELDCQ